MECNTFPCIICDHLDGTICSADKERREADSLPRCPLAPTPTPSPFIKPDIGKWVVKQPDGLFCYYNELTGSIEAEGLNLEQIIFLRMDESRLSYEVIEKDTLAQIEFLPFTWEDITR